MTLHADGPGMLTVNSNVTIGGLYLYGGGAVAVNHFGGERLEIHGSGAVNINTADEMVLRSIGMSGELAGKIIHFRESEPSKGGSADEIPNYFDNTANIVNYLTKKESLSAEESGKISGIIARGLLSVTSDNFGGLAVGKAGNGPGGSGAKITFVFDRKNNVMRYWRE